MCVCGYAISSAPCCRLKMQSTCEKVAVCYSKLQCVVARISCQSRCENFMSCCRQLMRSHCECVRVCVGKCVYEDVCACVCVCVCACDYVCNIIGSLLRAGDAIELRE